MKTECPNCGEESDFEFPQSTTVAPLGEVIVLGTGVNCVINTKNRAAYFYCPKCDACDQRETDR